MATYEEIVNESVTDLTILATSTLSIEVDATAAIQFDFDGGGGVFTDFTTEANNATANDVPLLPDPKANGDGFYIGAAHKFPWILFNMGTAGVGTYEITWKYWDGSAWPQTNLIYDSSTNYKVTGLARVHIAIPSDWALKTIEGQNLFWLFGGVNPGQTMTTQPLATQIWVSGLAPRARIMGGGSFNAKGKSPSGQTVNVSRYTANQTLVRANHNVFCDTDDGAFTVTLPPGMKGTEYRIVNTGSSGNNLTLAPDGAELLLGVNSSFVLSDSETLIIVYETIEGWF